MKKNKLEVALWKRFACIFAVIGITVITCLGFRNEETDVSPTPPATLPDDDIYEYISLDDACIAVNGFPWWESGKLNRLKPDTNYSTGVDKMQSVLPAEEYVFVQIRQVFIFGENMVISW